MRVRRIQDTIHGLMEFHGTESSVVDVLRARELQRLRRVRQLGLAHLVFPSGEHSRLVHSIGAAHVAIRFTRRLQEATRGVLIPFLQPGPDAVRDMALAALTHDLGHGPLSHLWEREVIGEHFSRAGWISALGLDADPRLHSLKWHELVGQALLAWEDGDLHKLLEQLETGTSTRIRNLLLGDYYLPYLPRLLSSDVDVDRCDFVLRDAYQSGVAYGRYDQEWLISTAAIGYTADGQLVSGFDARKAGRVVEQFLIARRAMYDTVYYHKTVRSAEGMIGLLLRRIKELVKAEQFGIGSAHLFTPIIAVMKGEPLSPSEILDLDDNSIWVFVQHVASSENQDPVARELARRLIGRDLYRSVVCESETLNEFFSHPDAHRKVAEIVKRHSPGDGAYGYHLDHSKFEMLAGDESQQGYFVESGIEGRRATPFKDHTLFRGQAGLVDRKTRLFVPREAVAAVEHLVSA